MKRYLSPIMLWLGLLISAPAQALDFDFSGTISNHNDVIMFSFTAAGSSEVTLFTSSWDEGGFDPILGLWDSAGNLIYEQDDGELEDTTFSNSISYDYGYWDSYYTVTLDAGSYQVSITPYDNFANGLTLARGFENDSDTPIPIGLWESADESYDTGNFEFHVLNVAAASQQVPEPMTLLLLGSGMAGLAIVRRFRNFIIN